jgi:hypothetical protein
MGRYVKFCTLFKIYYTVKFQDSLLNDSAYMVPKVRAIFILIFHTKAFKLWLCDLLQYQNHKNFLRATLTKHCCMLPLQVADEYTL